MNSELTLINYSQENNLINETYLKLIEKWSIYIIYQEYEDLMYLNFKSSRNVSGILIDGKLLGIYKQNIYKNEIASNIEIICKAIKLNYFNIKKDNINKYKKQKILTENQINELKNKGLELTDIPKIFISPPAFFVTPIWFLRTKHAWYWTPLKPEKNDINKSNWMIIYPNNSVKVIGGIYNGVEPAPKNVEIIRWLEQTKLNYLI